MTTIIKPIGKVGKGGAKIVKAGTKGVLKAAKKGVGTSSGSGNVTLLASRIIQPDESGTPNASGGTAIHVKAVRPDRTQPVPSGQRGQILGDAVKGASSSGGDDDEAEDVADVWKRKLKKELISPEEEKLLEDLLLKEDAFSGDTATEELVNNLTKQVYALDAANVYALLSSGMAMQDLVHSIDIADSQLDELHTWLSYYDNQLTSIQKYIKQIEENNNEMEVLTRNQHSLLEELDSIIAGINTLEAVVGAADRWEARYKAAILLRDTSPEIARMVAVQRQVAEFERLRDVFAARLDRFLSELFRTVDCDALETKAQVKDHKAVFMALEAYQELVHWLQRNRFSSYLQLAQTYTDCMQRMYEEEQRVFFAEIRRIIPKEPREGLRFATNTMDAHTGQTKMKKVEKALRNGLRDWISVVSREQIFSEEFFNFPASRDVTQLPSVISSGELRSDEVPLQQRKVQSTGSLESLLVQAFSAGFGAWGALFGSVTKYDYLTTLSLIVEIGSIMNKYEKDSIVLVRLLAQGLLVPAVRQFTKALDEEEAAINACQPSIKAAGILPPVHKFPLIVEEVEARLEGSAIGRRIADQALLRLYGVLALWLNSLGNDEPKLRHIVRAENFRYLYVQLWPEPKRGPRTDCLKGELEQALRNVDDNLTEFIHKLIANKKNFLPLVTFFDGIENLLRTLPPEEIQFQSSHSSEAFARLAPVLSRPRVEKRVAAMLRHISRNFGKEAGLIPVAFTRLQEVFLSDYGRYEQLTLQCYKHHNKLPLTASDLQEIFNTTQQQYV